jgi:hypothetical protein
MYLLQPERIESRYLSKIGETHRKHGDVIRLSFSKIRKISYKSCYQKQNIQNILYQSPQLDTILWYIIRPPPS